MKKISILILFALLTASMSYSQQDAQYTQYMYNTVSVNPAYAGSRDVLSLTGLYRTQWVGLRGAPRTFTISGHSPLKNEKLGLGISLVRDEIWVQDETYLDIDFSYTINTSADAKLAFGLKAGAHLINIDFSKANPEDDSDDGFDPLNNVDNRFSPNVGFGLYYYTDNFYIGYSAPTLLRTKYYEDQNVGNISYLSRDNINHYLIAGYVFDVSETTKLKPAVLFKAVEGAPLQADLSANLLFNEKFTVGLAYRWSAALSGMIGFQVSEGLMIGYGYDWETTELNNYNSGSHEIFLRWEFKSSKDGIISPRFF
ncbi:MAG: type IX secretion system membrane protein PorP/SprF [Bacteroidia bacterium]|nr:type IX secretion system membrane protein PorP/SprF [Bacteroidia bacterium]MBT8308772.1 type IX secretion system membrane protein PorP/SprF [Bacteroidia bacterium]NND10851.1 type IX secretion system membrane protein PorP/SprF [Flavobacteriaceae bacterium]NNL62027.1 type IX secretion system membrane protein PorP/SprF [Flavobacteriaceae bacterium]RZV65801.1 MAG: type IX secretion system membrane protein PorP/SprF [Flavobacteriaceae bacterium]